MTDSERNLLAARAAGAKIVTAVGTAVGRHLDPPKLSPAAKADPKQGPPA